MSHPLRLGLRLFHLLPKTDLNIKISTSLPQSCRFLYSKAALGIDNFNEQKQYIKKQLEQVESKFRERMTTFAAEDSKNMIFTEDLKNMIYLCESDSDFDLVVKMAKKFNSQNKQLRFGSFVFGPVLMRLFYIHQKPDVALECFKSPELTGLFDQLITFQLLLDLLLESGRYNEMLEMFDVIKERQLQGARYPRNSVVLVMAACYKLNSNESLEYALNLWKELSEAGHLAMRRATTFFAGLAINQGRSAVALEVLASINKPNYVTVRNLKVKAFCQVGRLEDALVILKSIFTEDVPSHNRHNFSKDVIDLMKGVVQKTDNPDVTLEFNSLEKLLVTEGRISDQSLESLLFMEINPTIVHNRQQNIFSRYTPDESRQRFDRRRPERPGLRDLM